VIIKDYYPSAVVKAHVPSLAHMELTQLANYTYLLAYPEVKHFFKPGNQGNKLQKLRAARAISLKNPSNKEGLRTWETLKTPRSFKLLGVEGLTGLEIFRVGFPARFQAKISG